MERYPATIRLSPAPAGLLLDPRTNVYYKERKEVKYGQIEE